MVQGSSSYDYVSSKVTVPDWEKSASKKTGFEAMQKLEREKKKAQEEKKYGAWGPTFKNKDHFSQMHHC